MKVLNWRTWPLLALLALIPVQVFGGVYTKGHADVGFGYEDGAWHPHLHAEGATIDGVEDVTGEFAPGEITIFVPNSVYVSDVGNPSVSDFHNVPESLGLTQGDSFWNLYDSSGLAAASSSPFLGIGAEEVSSGLFKNNVIDIQLTAFSGPGQFTLWSSATGVAMQTTDGVTSNDVLADFAVGPGSHSHWNWAFSEAGDYLVTLTAIGEFADGSGFAYGSGTWQFQVQNHVPEPSSLVLAALGFGGIGLVTYARRRRGK